MSTPRKIVSNEEKLQYAYRVVEDGYRIRKLAERADANTLAVGRWKRQYLEEKQGINPQRYRLYRQSIESYNVLKRP